MRVLAASAVMALVLELGRRRYPFAESHDELERIAYYLALCGAGGLSFLLAARLFRVRELSALESAVRRRLARAK
jgi:hypothetical protein